MAIWRTLPGYKMQIGSGETALLIVPTGTDVPSNRVAEMQAEATARGVYLMPGSVVTPDPEADTVLTRKLGDQYYVRKALGGTPTATTFLNGEGYWVTAAGTPGPKGDQGVPGPPGGVTTLSGLTDVSTAGAAAGRVVAVDGVGPLHATTMEYFKVLAGNPDLLIAGAITRDSNGAATGAPVVWPDGTGGVYTATTVSSAFPGAVDAYSITYDPTGTANDRTYTQPAVTRDANGAVTARPAVSVS